MAFSRVALAAEKDHPAGRRGRCHVAERIQEPRVHGHLVIVGGAVGEQGGVAGAPAEIIPQVPIAEAAALGLGCQGFSIELGHVPTVGTGADIHEQSDLVLLQQSEVRANHVGEPSTNRARSSRNMS